MTQSFWGVPDHTRPRAASETRRPNYKLRQQVNSLLDQLLAGGGRKLPTPIQGLHLLLGEIATIKYGATLERNARPYIDAYFRNGPRADVLQVAERLNVLAGAQSLFATMNETNRQDVQGVIAVLKRAALQELAARGIGVSLGMLAGRLSERDPDIREITKAWFSLEQGVGAAYAEGLDPIEYLQAGLECLPLTATRALAGVLAPYVPPQARWARHILEAVIHDTLRDMPVDESFIRLDTDMVCDAVRAHVLSHLDSQVTETGRRLENALRPGVRTAEVANHLWRDMRGTLDTIGWLYLEGIDGDNTDADAAIGDQTELLFIRAVALMQPATAAVCLERLDTERLLAMHAYREQWSGELRAGLAGPLDQACDVRFQGLLGNVQQARLDLDAVVAQDRRIATANALLVLGDALGGCERFALGTAMHTGWRDDPLVEAAILRAAASLRMPGEPGTALAQSLMQLDDAAFLDLALCDDPQVARGLSLDPAAVAAEARRRAAHLDAAVDARLTRLSDLLRSPALAPRSFVGMIAAIAMMDVARGEIMAVLGDGEAGHAVSPALSRELAMLLYRKDGAMPVQWMESRRHVGGLLNALKQIRAAADRGGAVANASYPDLSAPLDKAISILTVLGRHFGIRDGQAPSPQAADPYWNDGCLADLAPFFGLRYEPTQRHALPLCDAVHRARLLAALGMRMAHQDQADSQAVVTRVEGESRILQVDKQFHDAAYRRGELSLSAAGPAEPSVIPARAAGTGSELGRQSASSLDGALGRLEGFGNGMDAALTQLMSAVAQGIADFVQGAREMPQAWRWPDMPKLETVRHIHFDVRELARAGYRLDVAACLETHRPDMEVQLAFAMQVNATGRRVMRLIVPPVARLLPAVAVDLGNGSAQAATTAGIQHQPAAPIGTAALQAGAGS
jgi:hypothetical protein